MKKKNLEDYVLRLLNRMEGKSKFKQLKFASYISYKISVF